MLICDDVKLLDMAVAGLHNFSCYSHSSVGEFRYGSPISSKTTRSCLSQRGPEFVVGINGSNSDGVRCTSEDTGKTENQCTGGSETEHEDNLSCLSEQSSDVGRIENDRVRQVFRESMKSGFISNSSDGFRQTSSQLHSGNESEKVMITKEWVQISSTLQRNVRELDGDRDSVRNGMSTQRSIRRICGRQTLYDLLKRDQQKRKVELMALLNQSPVSGFAHRNRIQALLRGRFLRNENVVHAKKSSSVASIELGMLKLRRAVSDRREEFLSKSDSPLTLMNNTELNSFSCDEIVSTENHTTFEVDRSQTNPVKKLIDENHQVSPSIIQQLTDVEELPVEEVLNEISGENEGMCCSEHREYTRTDMEGIMSEKCDQLGSSTHSNELQISESGASEPLSNHWLYETSNNVTFMLELEGGWPSQDFQESIESETSSPSMELSEYSRTSCLVHLHDENIDRYTELQELFTRKQVSNLLRSSFGERLEQILRSHVERQRYVFVDPEFDNSSPFLTRIEHNRREENEDEFVLFSNHKDSVIINELRIEMAQLHEKMHNLQNMLEDCLDMQIELQRSIQQEVSSAINHSITMRDNSIRDQESNWDFLRRGICCRCRKSSIDSLLYRCGHMCTCTKCAEELVRCTGECPICRIPVLDIFRTN